MPRKPTVSPRKVQAIAKRLTQNVPPPEIAKAVKVSLSTVERVRADYRAFTYDAALARLDPGAYLEDPEYKQAERRAKGIAPAWRKAIIEGIADAITPDDLLDPAPVPRRQDPGGEP